MKVLITGSSGKIGRAIFKTVSAHYETIGIDLLPGEFTHFTGDVCDRTFVSKAIRNVNAVIHTAALHAPHVALKKKDEFERINYLGTKQLLQMALENGCDNFILTSTTSIYGNSLNPIDQAIWVTEELEPQPRDIYDETKLLAEQACEEAAKLGLRTTSIRMSRCFPEAERLMAIYRLYRGVDDRDVADAHFRHCLDRQKNFKFTMFLAQRLFIKAKARICIFARMK